MKLVRYGAKGSEKPGLIDKSGQLRDLSAHVRDLDGEAYAPASLAKLAALDASKLPAVDGKPRFGAPVTGISKFVAIGLNYVDHAKETGNPIPARADLLPEGQHLAVRPERRGREAARIQEARLGSRNRRHHRHPRQIRLRGRRAQSRCRLLRLQRRLRALLPDGARRPMDQGQVARHLRPGRPVARHQGRNPRRAEALDVARRQRQALPDRIDLDHDLHHGEVHFLRLDSSSRCCPATSSPRAPRPASAPA